MESRYERCPTCGFYEDEWPPGMIDHPDWEAVTHRCMPCREVESVRDGIPPKEKGVTVRLERKKNEDE